MLSDSPAALASLLVSLITAASLWGNRVDSLFPVATGASESSSTASSARQAVTACQCICEATPAPWWAAPGSLVCGGILVALLGCCIGVLLGSFCPRAAVRHRVEGPLPRVAAGKGQIFYPAISQ